MELSLRHREDPDGVTVSAHGEVDLHNAAELTDVLLAAAETRPDELRVDLGDVPFMDSMGVSALIVAYEHASAAGARFRVVGASPVVHRILSITGLLDLFGMPGAHDTARSDLEAAS